MLKMPNALTYEGKRIHITKGVVDRKNVESRVNQGSYYCGVKKVGGIESFGDYLPHRDFAVQPKWVTPLAAKEKISFSTAKQEYLRCVDRAEQNIRNLEWIIQQKREAREEEEQKAIAILIRKSLRAVQMPPSWSRFLKQHERKDKHRFSIYVLDGPSGLGKTEAIRLQYPIGGLLELNCQNTASPNWRLFNREEHRAILLDEATPQLCVNFKKEIQADNTICQEGTSATNVFSYKCWFYRIHFIVCCNKWEALTWNLDWDDWRWLEDNSIVEPVDELSFAVTSN